MGQLFFKKQLQIAIREGRKRTTIRRWAVGRPRAWAGKQAYALGVGWLAIESVEPIDLNDLSDEDAAADGFESKTHLLHVLADLYPDSATDGKAWFLIRFRLDRLEPPRRSQRRDAKGQAVLFETQ